MKLFDVDLDERPLVVAEIGVNHEGSESAAREMIELAKGAGADAVKLQSYTPARYASASDPARLERVASFALDEAAHRRLADHAAAIGVGFFSTPLTEDWVAKLAPMAPLYKIASGDLTFEPVIRAAAASGKPVILSTGLGTLAEIDQAVDWAADEIGDAALAERLILMQCVSAYPAPIEQAHVSVIPSLRQRFGLRVGYSNHVIGPEACYAAVALGADIVEVHFTDRKTGREFRDHELSFEPADLAILVAALPRIRASLGVAEKARTDAEIGNLKAVRKGLVAARDLPAGTVIAAEDVAYARPATEFASGERDLVIGRRLAEPVGAGELFRRAAVVDG